MMIKIIWILGVFGTVIYICVSRITFNPTISEPRGYYFAYLSHDYKVGDRVLICVLDPKYVHVLQQLKLPMVNNGCPNHMPFLLKQIVAVSGDQIDIREDGIYVNHKLEKNSKSLLKYKGINLLPSAERGFKLENNQFWLLGNTPHSYDSRYFGVVNRAQIMSKTSLIWQRNVPIW